MLSAEAVALFLLALIATGDCAKDLYAVLGLTRDAADVDIKKAYRRLSLRFHPDKNSDPGAKERFLECAEAYEVLGDPVRRQVYDSGGTTTSRTKSGGFSEEDARVMFDAFLDEFERMLSGDAEFGVTELVDGLWGVKETSRQGLLEWGAKQVFKQIARTAGGSLLRQARGIDIDFGGAQSDSQGQDSGAGSRDRQAGGRDSGRKREGKGERKAGRSTGSEL